MTGGAEVMADQTATAEGCSKAENGKREETGVQR